MKNIEGIKETGSVRVRKRNKTDGDRKSGKHVSLLKILIRLGKVIIELINKYAVLTFSKKKLMLSFAATLELDSRTTSPLDAKHAGGKTRDGRGMMEMTARLRRMGVMQGG